MGTEGLLAALRLCAFSTLPSGFGRSTSRSPSGCRSYSMRSTESMSVPSRSGIPRKGPAVRALRFRRRERRRCLRSAGDPGRSVVVDAGIVVLSLVTRQSDIRASSAPSGRFRTRMSRKMGTGVALPSSCRSDAGAGLIGPSRAVRPSAELGTLGWEGVDLIWADRKRYGVAGAKSAGEPASREKMSCEASVVHP